MKSHDYCGLITILPFMYEYMAVDCSVLAQDLSIVTFIEYRKWLIGIFQFVQQGLKHLSLIRLTQRYDQWNFNYLNHFMQNKKLDYFDIGVKDRNVCRLNLCNVNFFNH